MTKTSALVIFNNNFPNKGEKWWRQFHTVIAFHALELEVKKYNLVFVNLENLVDPGSVQEASAFTEELSRLILPDGSRLAKSFTYRGYELWWLHYQNLFLYFCLPYTQYKRLLEYLKNFHKVSFSSPPYQGLFSCYLRAYDREVKIFRELKLKVHSPIPFGVLLQIFITLLSLPILMLKRCRLMVFIGDKFEKSRDYDFRMKFIYQELRQRNLPFVEFIRSLESWKTVLQHALTRKRPVIYSEAVAFAGRFCGILFGGRRRARREFNFRFLVSERDPMIRFKFLIATQHLLTVYDDIYAIRIMKWILLAIGIRVAIIEVASGRSFRAVLGCKLNNIPTVGILHGVPSKYYTVYDFMPGFNGAKLLSVDKYGLWSEWWKEYYLKNSKAYRSEQLYVSGPMRPLEKDTENFISNTKLVSGQLEILFISEQLAVPQEVVPYLEGLLKNQTLGLAIKFRPYRDGFERWLLANRPDLLKTKNIRILRGSMPEAIEGCDVVVGSHSTAVLEALLQCKVPIFFNTKKWGDYFGLAEPVDNRPFFAENPDELIERVKNARVVSKDDLNRLKEKYFGDPYQNGSKWVVDQAVAGRLDT